MVPPVWLVVFAKGPEPTPVPSLPRYSDEVAAWRAAINFEKAGDLPSGAVTVVRGGQRT
jgi:hypothetical protein